MGYASTPSGAKEPFEKPSPIVAIQEVSAAAAKYVIEKYPINSPYAVNLPGGMTRSGCERVIRLMKDENARILTTQTQSLPIVHVEFVSIIGDSATVRVFRPVGLSALQEGRVGETPGGPTSLTQAMEVRVRGGLAPWHAVAMRGLMLGAIPTPELNIVPTDPSEAPEEPATEPTPTDAEAGAAG